MQIHHEIAKTRYYFDIETKNKLKTINNMDKYSFIKGFGQVQNKDVRLVKSEIMVALGIKTRYAWGLRLKGEIEPRVSEAEAIEKIFKSHGIKSIWGK